MPSVGKLNLGDHWTLQQDNDPKHTSESTKAWLRNTFWNVLGWPFQSLDLIFWWDLKNAIAAQKPSNISELEAFAGEEWAKIPTERFKKHLPNTLIRSYKG